MAVGGCWWLLVAAGAKLVLSWYRSIPAGICCSCTGIRGPTLGGSRCAVGAQSVRSRCAVGAHSVRSRCAVGAQSVTSIAPTVAMVDSGGSVTLIFQQIQKSWHKEHLINLLAAFATGSNFSHVEMAIGEDSGLRGEMVNVLRIYNDAVGVVRKFPPPYANRTLLRTLPYTTT